VYTVFKDVFEDAIQVLCTTLQGELWLWRCSKRDGVFISARSGIEKKWLKAIPRADFVPTKFSKLHFEVEDIV
jgi:hypothetical protein